MPSLVHDSANRKGRGITIVREEPYCGYLLLLVLFIPIADLARAQTSPTEYEIKAAFVYNFAKFVEWPQEAFANAGDPVRFCVFGNTPLDSDLQQLITGKTIGARPVQVQRTGFLQIKQCHVLFIGASDSARILQVQEATRGATVLTVGEFPGFLDQGGMINFIFDQNRIRFEVNLKAAQEAKLKLSSKLLSLAKRVQM